MLGGAGIRRSGAVSGLARQRLTAIPRFSRSISSFGSHRSRVPVRYGAINQSLVGNSSWRATPSMPGSVTSARFNSTSSNASAASATTAAATSENASESASQSGLSDIPDLTAADVYTIPEKIGYLKDLGLDYGWGPTSIVEFVLEHLHIYSGLPWWASIMGTGLLIRLALLKPLLGATDAGTKLRNAQHITKPIQKKMFDYSREGNQVAMTEARMELSRVNQERGIKPWKVAVPMLQVPLGFGCYRLFEGMCHLPVPGLATESVGWLKNLTVADPYYILPLLSSSLLYLNLRKGAAANQNPLFDSAAGKALIVAFPLISLTFMCFFPAALQLYFATTGACALFQTYLLSSRGFRMWAGIEIPDPVLPDAAGAGVSPGIRTMSSVVEAKKAKAKELEMKRISLLDRAVNSVKDTGANIKRDTVERVSEIRGNGPKTNADGSPAEPPRLSEKDRKLAASYDNRRRQEEEWKREERNQARKEAHMKALEAQKEKAAQSWSARRKGTGNPKAKKGN